LKILSHDGFDVTGSLDVADGATQLVLTFNGFTAGEKLVFTIDVDEQGNLQPNAVAEGAEFEGATLTTTFTAPYMADITTPAVTFYDAYSLADTGLEDLLPNDIYDNSAAQAYLPENCSPGLVYTAGANGSVQQTPLPITLSGTVFEDLNVDNHQQTGEPGIADVGLTLYELIDGNYVSTDMTTTSDADGNYKFEELLPGTYRVIETQPYGYLSVGNTPGTVGGATRGVVTTVDILSSINLDGGEDSIHNDFAETLPADLSGYVYHDANNNGTMDPGEEGIEGVLLVVERLSDHAQIDVYSEFDGYWWVGGLMPGEYKVTEVQPAGYLDGLDVAGTAGGAAHNPGDLIDGVYLVGGQWGWEYDFGELLPACISGYVYLDANNNGVFDAGESPLAGVELALVNAMGNPTGETRVTDEMGFYYFCGLAPGVYGVTETQPEGYLDGLDTPGPAGGTAHNPGDRIDGIPVLSGVSAKLNNFGELLPASIRGCVFADWNVNNVYDTGDTVLGGVTVCLLNGSGTRIGSTTTDGNGKYAFVDLAPGVYGIEEVQPAGYLEGADRVGSAGGALDGPNFIRSVSLDSGVDGVNYDFWEVPPAMISGYVFQDGPAIVLEKGDPLPHIPGLRDGIRTPDDKPLSGVVLQLCDGSGSPLTGADGKPITTTTDANGYYEFANLTMDDYTIVEVQPAGYLSGIDTAGTKGGYVVGSYTYDQLPKSIQGLGLDPAGKAIARIQINPGDVAAQYNFSHVLVQYNPPSDPVFPTPPSPPWPWIAPPVAVFGEFQPMGVSYSLPLRIAMNPMAGGSGGPGGYTWHLSIIDAGQPRRDGSGDRFAQSTQNSIFDPVSWTGADMDQSQWILADASGAPIQTVHFGMRGATPVAGDWDGSGVTKIGVFAGGLWFLDLDGDGQWDEADLWVKLGRKDDQPVAGDWNGDGKTDVGIFGPAWVGDLKAVAVEPGLPDAQNRPAKPRPKNVPPDQADAAVGYRTLKKGHVGKMRSDVIDHVFEYGTKGDRAVVGDWNGDGIYTIGIFRDGAWFLDMDGDGRWSEGDVAVQYGQEGDLPVVGDWTGDGFSKLGIFRDGKFSLDVNNNRKLDAADKVIELGHAGDRPVVGDWTGDGVDKVGVYKQSAAAESQTASAASGATTTR
jgi:hypothetical protein